MIDLLRKLGERIKGIRKISKLTQEKLAERTSLSVEYISRVERGVTQPSLKTLAVMAESLNVTVKDFFDLKMPVLFKDRKQESQKRKEYIEFILGELNEMDIRDVEMVYNIIMFLTAKQR